ncbi:MAG: hypothetical protein WBP45_02975 [Daejeonella sp.]
MKKKSETGHAVNVANLGTLVRRCKSYAAAYQPSNPAIAIVELEATHAASRASIKKVNLVEKTYSKLAGIRRVAFNPLSALGARILRSFSSCKASAEDINTAKAAVRKLRGQRAEKKEAPDLENPEEDTQNISVSQMGFDNRINNFDRLVQTVKLEPKYNPNEAELKVSGLEDLHEDLNLKNEAARDAGETLDDARKERDRLLYAEDTGLVSLAADVKNYVWSVYGPTSTEYKQISGITFRR